MNAPAAIPRPPRLTLRFALYAGVALALAGGASVWVGSRQVTTDEQRSVWEDARYIAERLGRDDLARSALEQPAVGDRRAELDELFDREALGPNASAVTLFRRDGRVTYSTEHAQIGTVHEEPELLERALAGEAVYGVAGDGDEKVLESYVPVQWVLADPTWPAGVLRVSRDYAPVQQEIADKQTLQAVTTLLALVLLYLALFPILRRVTNTLAARNRSLVDSEARWRALTEQASDAIFVVDPDGFVVQANERACRLLDRSPDAVLDRNFGDFVEPGDLARVPLRLQEVLDGDTVLQERRLVRRDGSTVLAELSSSMLDDGRVLAIARDVTERNELEEQRRRALRAEATERLASGIAHDFEHLIASIAAFSEVGLGRTTATDELRRPLEKIREASLRGAELTRQLLVFGSRNESEPRVLDLPELFAGMDSRLRAMAGRQIRLVTDVAADVGRVAAAPEELEEVVATLVLNACEHVAGGGTVAVSASNVDFMRRRRGAAADSRVEPGHYVMLSVSDDGSVRDGGRDASLGVGLAAAFAVVQRRGGTLGVESDPEHGTTIRVYLPRVEAPAVHLVQPQAAPVDLRGTETILVAEDEQIVRAVVREMLEERGYTVLEAGSGVEALHVVAGHDGPIDLLLTDLVMPDMGGRELAAAMVAAHSECRVVFMSGYADATPEPGVTFLEKPFTHESLAHTVRHVLDTQRAAA